MRLRIQGKRTERIAPKDGETYEILVEENAEATIVEQGTGAYAIDITLKPNAILTYCSVTQGATVIRRAVLDDDARLAWVDAATDGTRSEVITRLAGTGADASYRSVMLGREDERPSVKSSMLHDGDRSTSTMHTRAVLLGRSKGDYEGLIRIHHDAKGCDAYQKEETLLLSDDARMDATPNLEISNEDVRCSHGVSLGKIDEEKLFYFRARGIPGEEARRLIVHGFFEEILAAMDEGTRMRVLARMEAA